VAEEYGDLQEGHPGVGRVIRFARGSGARGWRAVLRELWESGRYEEVVDLHRSLRTLWARLLFLSWDLAGGRRTVWRTLRKERVRTWGYYVLKSAWPARWRPKPMIARFRQAAGLAAEPGRGPDLRHLCGAEEHPAARSGLSGDYYCVMPAARWPSKQWPAARFLDAIRALSGTPVILGTAGDQASCELRDRLRAEGLQCHSLVGATRLREAAAWLRGARFYLGNDTGMAHLAEAVGTPAYVVFGPTAADAGFGPWREGSRGIALRMWCRPCGKSGKWCYRVGDRFGCLRNLSGERVSAEVRDGLRQATGRAP
jgi:ADP-heptose:LPS heptosyltransferase